MIGVMGGVVSGGGDGGLGVLEEWEKLDVGFCGVRGAGSVGDFEGVGF